MLKKKNYVGKSYINIDHTTGKSWSDDSKLDHKKPVSKGLYRKAERLGWTTDENGEISIGKSAFLASVSGALSGITATPNFVVKTRMQASANPNIAVGRQHKYKNTLDAFSQIFKKDGVKGFYVGFNATCTRLAVGSAVQMSSFSTVKELLLHAHHEHFVNSNALLAFSASSVSGLLVAIVMCPMDVITTRYDSSQKRQPRSTKVRDYHQSTKLRYGQKLNQTNNGSTSKAVRIPADEGYNELALPATIKLVIIMPAMMVMNRPNCEEVGMVI
ncbi:Solute carrier family 25 member 35 [Eumeta japonica]|uniref:Solute carrier family 25 member 35 n=1 Tax=Eumeta variegata TaxID=151549 RepID=A0A4C1XZT0_EUMVA|nr:Solute carrier family 25 member 35 [Eumeta japonica]